MWMRASLLVLVFAASATRDHDDAKLLSGRWKAVSREVDGVTTAITPAGIEFKDGRFRWDGDGGSGTYILDPSNGTVDYTNAGADGTPGGVYRGIYEVTATTFRDCFRRQGQKRPQLMRTRRGDGVICVDYVRDDAKPEETPSKDAPDSI